jgi:dihydrofolate reductase
MRKLILSLQISLDGFAESEDGYMTWMQKDDNDQWEDLFEMLKSVDLFLLGRVMWPDYRDYWKSAMTSKSVSANERAYALLAEKTPHIVFSRTVQDSGWHNKLINHGPVASEVKRLKLQPGKNIQIVGGPKLANTLIEAGLVDEYRLVVNPYILSKGKSLFHGMTIRSKLRLQEAKTLKSGAVILKYITT